MKNFNTDLCLKLMPEFFCPAKVMPDFWIQIQKKYILNNSIDIELSQSGFFIITMNGSFVDSRIETEDVLNYLTSDGADLFLFNLDLFR